MSSFKGEVTEREERYSVQLSARCRDWLGVVGVTEDHLSHFASPIEWEAEASF